MALLSRNEEPAEETARRGGVIENLRSMVYAIGLALIFRSLLFEPFHIPSGSMRSTLLEGDYIFVTKYAYGYSRYSFPFGARANYFSGRTGETLPERGDVVVFRLPSDTTIDYIKRVIGLPGDTVRVSSGRVYVNEKRLDYEREGDFTYRESATRASTVARYREILPNERSYNVLDSTYSGNADNTEIFEVPEGHLFVMGDNRDHSVDSRFSEVGFIPLENILGRADVIFFGINTSNDAPFWQFWHWFRGERFFRSLDA